MTATPSKQGPEFIPPLPATAAGFSRLERGPLGLWALASAGPKDRGRNPSLCEGCGGGNVGNGIGNGIRRLDGGE